jgi:hypothetical protein
MRLLALLCMVIVCSVPAQDSITGDPPPCAASDTAMSEFDPADPAGGDTLDSEEAEAQPHSVVRPRLSQRFFSTGTRLTRPPVLLDIPPELAL